MLEMLQFVEVTQVVAMQIQRFQVREVLEILIYSNLKMDDLHNQYW